MADHIEHACFHCGSLLHQSDRCAQRPQEEWPGKLGIAAAVADGPKFAPPAPPIPQAIRDEIAAKHPAPLHMGTVTVEVAGVPAMTERVQAMKDENEKLQAEIKRLGDVIVNQNYSVKSLNDLIVARDEANRRVHHDILDDLSPLGVRPSIRTMRAWLSESLAAGMHYFEVREANPFPKVVLGNHEKIVRLPEETKTLEEERDAALEDLAASRKTCAALTKTLRQRDESIKNMFAFADQRSTALVDMERLKNLTGEANARLADEVQALRASLLSSNEKINMLEAANRDHLEDAKRCGLAEERLANLITDKNLELPEAKEPGYSLDLIEKALRRLSKNASHEGVDCSDADEALASAKEDVDRLRHDLTETKRLLAKSLEANCNTEDALAYAALGTAAPEPSGSVLLEAEGIVNGPRRASYGHPKVNHERTADFWTTYLVGRGWTPPQGFGRKGRLDGRDVCHLNGLQKVSRDCHSRKRDNLTDISGWAENARLVDEPEDMPQVSSEIGVGQTYRDQKNGEVFTILRYDHPGLMLTLKKVCPEGVAEEVTRTWCEVDNHVRSGRWVRAS